MEAVISSSQKTPVLLGLEKDFFFAQRDWITILSIVPWCMHHQNMTINRT